MHWRSKGCQGAHDPTPVAAVAPMVAWAGRAGRATVPHPTPRRADIDPAAEAMLQARLVEPAQTTDRPPQGRVVHVGQADRTPLSGLRAVATRSEPAPGLRL